MSTTVNTFKSFNHMSNYQHYNDNLPSIRGIELGRMVDDIFTYDDGDQDEIDIDNTDIDKEIELDLEPDRNNDGLAIYGDQDKTPSENTQPFGFATPVPSFGMGSMSSIATFEEFKLKM